MSRRDLLATCAAFRIAADDDSLPAMTRLALRELAQRVVHLDIQLALVGKRLDRITRDVAPELIAIKGVGPEIASTLLMTAGDNPERMKSEASFAALCGSNPIPASSGKTNRHRLNRGGDRHAIAALWRVVVVRLSCDTRTRDYLAKRLSEGKTKTEAIRCLKRYVAREVYNAMALSCGQLTVGASPTHRYFAHAVVPLMIVRAELNPAVQHQVPQGTRLQVWPARATATR